MTQANIAKMQTLLTEHKFTVVEDLGPENCQLWVRNNDEIHLDRNDGYFEHNAGWGGTGEKTLGHYLAELK